MARGGGVIKKMKEGGGGRTNEWEERKRVCAALVFVSFVGLFRRKRSSMRRKRGWRNGAIKNKKRNECFCVCVWLHARNGAGRGAWLEGGGDIQ